jgi:GTPase
MTRHRRRLATSSLPASASGHPIVAIVGRPNVGKSTLFNRLARAKLAIVHDEPGVTRDRHYASTMLYGRPIVVVDTGGYDPEDEDPMKTGIARHVREAIKEADVIVFVSDAMTDLTHADRAAVDLLRRTSKPVLFVANKADSPRLDGDAFELYRLGVKEVIPVSALHGRGMQELELHVYKHLPQATPEPTPEPEERLPRIALIGRPNAGKSSLLNRLLGEDRMLVDSMPGTTRDAIDALVEVEGQKFIVIDTAGLRRKAKVIKADDAVESMSTHATVETIERADITILVSDGSDGVAEQDAKIMGLAADRGRALIIAVNKCDLLSKDQLSKAEEDARDKLSFAPWAPLVRISAKTGRGVKDLVKAIVEVDKAFHGRVTTGALNRFFAEVLEHRSPPTKDGKAPRIYFITQAETAPPTFVVITNAPDSIHFSYQRYVSNQLRKTFNLKGTPIRVIYKEKRKRAKGAPKGTFGLTPHGRAAIDDAEETDGDDEN